MTITAHIVNAFAENGGHSGNPAAVILGEPSLLPEQRQAIAKTIGVSETVFLDSQRNGKAQFKASFYTPTRPIANCGHATIAAFSLVHEFTGKSFGAFDVEFNNDEGSVQDIYTDNESIFLRLKKPKYFHGKESLSRDETLEITESLGLKPRDIDHSADVHIRSFGNPFILVSVKSAEALRRIHPNFNHLETLSSRFNVIGFYPFTRDVHVKGRDAAARMFAPRYGIPEESATGMAAAALAEYLHEHRGLRQSRFLIEQGRFMNRSSPSLVEARMETSILGNLKAIQIGGQSYKKNEIVLSL